MTNEQVLDTRDNNDIANKISALRNTLIDNNMAMGFVFGYVFDENKHICGTALFIDDELPPLYNIKIFRDAIAALTKRLDETIARAVRPYEGGSRS